MSQEVSFLISDGEELMDTLRQTQLTHTITELQLIGERRLLLRMKPVSPLINRRGNVFIGTVTTQKGQLRLVRSLLTIDEQVLYCDTDSAIYFTTPLYPKRLPLGHFIGDWTNELSKYDRDLRNNSGDTTATTMISKLHVLASKAYAKCIEPRLEHHRRFMYPIEECKLKVYN
jgi:hypothetical protein